MSKKKFGNLKKKTNQQLKIYRMKNIRVGIRIKIFRIFSYLSNSNKILFRKFYSNKKNFICLKFHYS